VPAQPLGSATIGWSHHLLPDIQHPVDMVQYCGKRLYFSGHGYALVVPGTYGCRLRPCVASRRKRRQFLRHKGHHGVCSGYSSFPLLGGIRLERHGWGCQGIRIAGGDVVLVEDTSWDNMRRKVGVGLATAFGQLCHRMDGNRTLSTGKKKRLRAFWAACPAIKHASESSPRSWCPRAMRRSCSAWRSQRRAMSYPGFIDHFTFLERSENKGIALRQHMCQLRRSIDQNIGMHARRAEQGHGFQALHKGLGGVFDHQYIQVALGIGLPPGHRAKQNNALRAVGL
jgi:hypothetical protein